jgi:hypothetical protein
MNPSVKEDPPLGSPPGAKESVAAMNHRIESAIRTDSDLEISVDSETRLD